MNKRIERMKREIERRGGMIFGFDNWPDDIVERFFKEVLTCPDCAGTASPEGESIDQVLAGGSCKPRRLPS